MKFVFLDIDGVANNSDSVAAKIGLPIESTTEGRQLRRIMQADGVEDVEYMVEYALRTADPVSIALLNKVLEQPDVGLVLSSTHRKYLLSANASYGSDEHLTRLRLYLTAMGLKVPRYLSITPDLHKTRGDEVDQWLNLAYENGMYDDGDPYLIIDDAGDFYTFQTRVQVNPSHGFTFTDYGIACNLLQLKEPGLILL